VIDQENTGITRRSSLQPATTISQLTVGQHIRDVAREGRYHGEILITKFPQFMFTSHVFDSLLLYCVHFILNVPVKMTE